jgi:hypothetical protein
VTESNFEVNKVGERVFLIGTIDYDSSFIEKICKILDFGFKFIPCFHFNNFHIFKSLLISIDNEMVNFNKSIHLKLISEEKRRRLNLNPVLDNFVEQEKECDSFNCIFKKLKNKKNFDRIPTYDQSLIFQMNLVKNLKDLKINNNINLNLDQLNTLKQFLKVKPFKVVELDKNVGAGIISTQLFEYLAFKHLENPDYYDVIDQNPLNDLIDNLCILKSQIVLKRDISYKLERLLFDPNSKHKLGSFRILPKIHKKIFSIRPIINYGSNPISKICELLDLILRPYVEKCESYIKDSQDLMGKVYDLTFKSENINLYSCDFESLYSNIDHNDCLFVLCDFMKDKLDTVHLKISGFHKILEFVLENNFFHFQQNKFYRQKLGIAMGSKCGPSIANIYVYCYEKKWLSIHKPLFYTRFIDDIFIIIEDNLIIDSLKRSFGNLKLNCVNGKSVNFLDLTISYDKITCTLVFRPYYKVTNTHSYLQTLSNHPKFIFKNIPKSLFIRLRRICSYDSDFMLYSSILKNHLVKRGYNIYHLNKVFNMVFKLKRIDLLEYKDKSIINPDKIIFRNTFDKNILNFNSIFKESWENSFDKLPNFNFFIINKMQNNLFSILVHEFRLPTINRNYYKICDNHNCNTCEFSDTKYFVDCLENFKLPILDHSSCNSENCVYIIHCKLCNSFYIGQTVKIKDRIYKHLYDIKKFVPYTSKQHNTSVSVHFNLRHHNFYRDFKFMIFKKDIMELRGRLKIESFLINIFKDLNLDLMNDHIPLIKTIYNT